MSSFDTTHIDALSQEPHPRKSKNIDWEPPIEFDYANMPSFPLEAFPEVLSEFFAELAAATETPIELACLLGLGTLSACVARAFTVEVSKGYHEQVNLWTCVALESGNRKTPVWQACTYPLVKWQKDRAEELEPKVKDIESVRRSKEAYIKSLRGSLSDVSDSGEQAGLMNKIAELERDLPEVPHVPQLWTSDITPEKLGVIMFENGERMALISDEGGVFDTLAGRYSGGIPNLDLFLKSYSGSPERVDRGGRKSVFLEKPSLAIAISPQPSVLQTLASFPGFRGRGLLARFLYAVPRSLLGERTMRGVPVTDRTRDNYHALIRALIELTFESNGTALRPPRIIRVSDKAYRLWMDFSLEQEPKLREGEAFSGIKDWASKLPGNAARIAGLIHIAKYAHKPNLSELEIEDNTMLGALEIADTLRQHALITFGMMYADPDLENAKYILSWIKRKDLMTFSQRDCHHDLQHRFKKVDHLRPALQILTERHYIAGPPETPKKEGKGGRPSLRFLVNPALARRDS